uniref:Uncharacterized protein n=1 Tax=Aegilops tauschii subsp. strangulata TaxID=200361 RepID=A0A453MBD2_AEGTS
GVKEWLISVSARLYVLHTSRPQEASPLDISTELQSWKSIDFLRKSRHLQGN